MGGFHSNRSSICGAVLLAGVLPFANTASAAVEISTKPTANMSCSGGVCTPTAAEAVLNVNDLAGMLASGDTSIKSTSQNPDIEIDAALSWTSTSRLTLDSYHAIAFNKPVEVTGTGALTITTNDGGTDGDFRFFGKGHVKFWDLSSSLIINGNTYKLENKIKALKGAMGHNGHVGNFALADSINAKGHVYPKWIIPVFEGNFEGLGNTISNLTINDSTSGDYVGFFGSYGTEGSPANAIRDIRLSNVSISGFGDGQNVGSLVGYLGFGTVKNSSASGQVSGGSTSSVGGLIGYSVDSVISGSHASATVSGSDGAKAVGGLVGLDEGGCPPCMGVIDQSFASGSVTGGSNTFVGGLAGENLGATITNSYATGSASGASSANVGGLVGGNIDNTEAQAIPAISNSYSTGLVTGGSGASVGGLIGSDAADARNSDLYWDMDTSGVTNAAQGAGNIQNDPGITGLSDAQLKSGLPAGFNASVWAEKTKLNSGYPYLIDSPPPK